MFNTFGSHAVAELSSLCGSAFLNGIEALRRGTAVDENTQA
jgi:hypothetical protein